MKISNVFSSKYVNMCMNGFLEECVHWLHSKQWKEKTKEQFKMRN